MARILGRSIVTEDKGQDSTLQGGDDSQSDSMDVSGSDAGTKDPPEEGGGGRGSSSKEEIDEGRRETRSPSNDSSQFETAPTHQRVYPALPLMDTQLSFLTPSSQPSAPPHAAPTNHHDVGSDCKKSAEDSPEQGEHRSGRDSPRISTLLALRSTRTTTTKKPASSTPLPPPSTAAATTLRTASTILESLQRGNARGDSSSGAKAQATPTRLSPPTSARSGGSSSKRKPSPKNVRHAIPNRPNSPPSAANGGRNGAKAPTGSHESTFETAQEGREREGCRSPGSKCDEDCEGKGEVHGGKSEVIIHTNTYTHLGTKRKSAGAFGGGASSTDSSSSSSSENWQTARLGESNGRNGGSPSPTKRPRSMDTPSVPSLRRALGGSKVIVTNAKSNSFSNNSTATPPPPSSKPAASQLAHAQVQGGHTRSLSIGSGLAAILSRPISGKFGKSPPSSVVVGGKAAAQREKEPPVVKKEPTHSWLAQLFHKS